MALTKEDLLAIKVIVDDSVSGLKEDVSELKSDMVEVKADICELKEDVSELKVDVSNLKSDMKDVKERLTKIEVVQLENRLIPAVDEIISYQRSTYDRYHRDADRFEEKMGIYDTTVQVVAEHSVQIKELKLKQA